MKPMLKVLIVFSLFFTSCASAATPATETHAEPDSVEPAQLQEIADGILNRMSPCPSDSEDEREPLENTYIKIEDWWTITGADDEALGRIEAMDGSDPQGWDIVSVTGDSISGARSGETLEEIVVDLSLAASIRVGLENDAAVTVATRGDVKSVVVVVVQFQDGSTVFGGSCGNERHLHTLEQIHGDDLESVVREMSTLTGSDLVDFLEIAEASTNAEVETAVNGWRDVLVNGDWQHQQDRDFGSIARVGVPLPVDGSDEVILFSYDEGDTGVLALVAGCASARYNIAWNELGFVVVSWHVSDGPVDGEICEVEDVLGLPSIPLEFGQQVLVEQREDSDEIVLGPDSNIDDKWAVTLTVVPTS